MNKERRKQVEQGLEFMRKALSEIEAAASEEREAYDGMPGGLQQSERGQASEAWADALETAKENLESDIAALEGCE